MKHDPGAIQALKSRMNIADVVRRYLELKPAGARLVGLCPFHNEKTASFSVNQEKGVFYCFGCQASGDVIDFYCRINGLDFREGLEQLAREAGVALAEYRPDPEEDRRRRQRQAASDMHALARDFFRDRLRSAAGGRARAYLERRRVSPEMAERFQLGYAPDDYHGLERHLTGRGFKPRDAVAAGLLVENDEGRVWDRFRDRLMFPIHEVSGRVVAFGGRVMGEGEPKYLNSADSVVYKKGEHLFGLNQARANLARAGRVILTEGYLDVIALHQHGFTESVGVLGTALTPQQVKRLTGFTRQVMLVFDGDEAGGKAALRSARMLLSQGAECRVALLPQGEDADSLLASGGPEAFRACLDQAREGLDFCLATVRRTRAAKDMVDWALEFLDELTSDGVKAVMLTRLAQGLGVGEHELRGLAASRTGRPGGKSAAPAGSARPAGAQAKKDAELLEFAIRHPDYIPALRDLGVEGVLSSDRARAFWSVLAEHGRSDPLPYLDERQKSFWGQCTAKEALSREEAEIWWNEIEAHVRTIRGKARERELIEAMRQARDRGDAAEESRLLADLNAILGRKE